MRSESPGGTSSSDAEDALAVLTPNSESENLELRSPSWHDVAMDRWMSRISSDSHMSELSIAGTHESCALIALPFVQCQNMPIDEQLKAGIRYLDFRCGVWFGSLYLFHGRSPLGFALSAVLATIYAWLDRAPSESLMVQIKMEGGTGDEGAFETLLRSELSSNAEFWSLGNVIPRLGQIRGKIQLMRRFPITSGTLGIDVGAWADNRPKFSIPIGHSTHVIVQDQYEYTDDVPTFAELVTLKSGVVNDLVDAAGEDKKPQTWYLNWCNAYARPSSLGVIATPLDVAVGRNDQDSNRARRFIPGVNSTLFNTNFLTPKKGRLGTILLDFAETPVRDLISAIVLTNTFTDATTNTDRPI